MSPRFLSRLCAAAILVLTVACSPSPAPPEAGRPLGPGSLAPGPQVIAGLAADGRSVEVRVEGLPAGAVLREVWLAGPADSRLSGILVESRARGPEPRAGLKRPNIGLGATGGSSSGVDPSLSLSWDPDTRPRDTRPRDSLWIVPLPEALRPDIAAGGWRVEASYRDSDGIARTLRRPVRTG